MNLKRLTLAAALTFPLLVVPAGCNSNPTTMTPFDAMPNSASGLTWVNYTDSAEGAFSVDLPLGWLVQGGMYRFGYFDLRWMVDVRSLDGKVILRMDDPNVPPFVLPGPHSGPAGHIAIKPQQYQMLVANYQQARPFAEGYAKHRFSGVCKTLTPRTADWTPRLPAAWATKPGSRVTQATVAYDCATSDGPRIIQVFARNTLVPGSEGLWQSDPLLSLIATPEATPLAQSMLQRMLDTWQANPQWLQYQQRMTQMGLEQIRANFGQFLSQMQTYHNQREAAMNQQVARYQAGQNAQAQQVSSWGDTLTGVTTVRDASTGYQYQVFSGPKSNYYRNGAGVTVNSNISPGPDFHQVNQVSP